MKKLAFILGISLVVVACHTKKPQNESGLNDPTNITYGDVDQSVQSKSGNEPKAEAKKHVEHQPAAIDTAASCIDSSKINKEAMCTQEYAPVCGCDGKTYSNKCVADNAGVTKYTEGECAGDKAKTEKPKAGKPKAKRKK